MLWKIRVGGVPYLKPKNTMASSASSVPTMSVPRRIARDRRIREL